MHNAHFNLFMPFWHTIRIVHSDHSILLDLHKNCSMLLFEGIGALKTRFFHYKRRIQLLMKMMRLYKKMTYQGQ